MERKKRSHKIDEQEKPKIVITESATVCDAEVQREVEAQHHSNDESTIASVKCSEAPFPSIDGYEFIESLGSGGMGEVFKVKKHNGDKPDSIFAVKVLRAEFVDDPVSRKKFETEAKACLNLTNPHLVSVYEFGATKEGKPFLTMDYVEGETLSTLLQKRNLNVDECLAICSQILDALEHVHKSGIVHRDLKPSNIMLSTTDGASEFHAKVVDFGIAKAVPRAETDEQRVTQTGEVLGSPVYMSPEQCTGERVDERSDIYSLGCVMYEMMMGRPPFLGDNVVQTILQHLNKTPAFFDEKLKSNTKAKAFEEVVFKCLEKKPAQRYQSAEELKLALGFIEKGDTKEGSRRLEQQQKRTKIRQFLKRFDRRMYFSLMAAFAVLLVGSFFIFHTLNERHYHELVDQAEVADTLPNFKVSRELWKQALAEAERLNKPLRIQAALHNRYGAALAYDDSNLLPNTYAEQSTAEYAKALSLYDRLPGFDLEKVRTIGFLTNALTGPDYLFFGYEPFCPKLLKQDDGSKDEGKALELLRSIPSKTPTDELMFQTYEEAISQAVVEDTKYRAWGGLGNTFLALHGGDVSTLFSKRVDRAKQCKSPEAAIIELKAALALKDDNEVRSLLIAKRKELSRERLPSRYFQAYDLLKRKLDMEASLLGKESRQYLETLSNLAVCGRLIGELPESEQYLRSAIAQSKIIAERERKMREGRDAFSSGPPDTTFQIDLAALLAEQGKFSEAKVLYEKLIHDMNKPGDVYSYGDYSLSAVRSKYIETLLVMHKVVEAAEQIDLYNKYLYPNSFQNSGTQSERISGWVPYFPDKPDASLHE